MFRQELEGDHLAIAELQEEAQDDLLKKENVVGVGVGNKLTGGEDTGEACITVSVSQKLDDQWLSEADTIPERVNGFRTDVIETGEIFAGRTPVSESSEDLAFDEDFAPESLRGRVRPVNGGFSVGHHRVTAGTIATAVYPSTPFPGIPGRYYILSNNHVLANSNNARIGDPILQPGRYDGGKLPQDVIARLARFVPIKFNGSNNYVDAAIAEAEFHHINREIYWIGYVNGIDTVQLGDMVQKTGRTTSYTTGRVLVVNATVNVNYGGGRVARFARQIVTSNMSAGGDSGSLLCDMDRNAVGLLYAGSSRVTIHNDIRYVQALLNIRLV
jgi:hypothetical protein